MHAFAVRHPRGLSNSELDIAATRRRVCFNSVGTARALVMSAAVIEARVKLASVR